MLSHLADIFIVLFILSFIITIFGLIKWVNIDDKYLSKLFTFVIISGIVSGVVTLFTNNFINSKPVCELSIIQPGKWVAWDLDKNQITQPIIKHTLGIGQDTTKRLGLSKQNAIPSLKDQVLSINIEDNRYYVAKDSSPSLGYIPDYNFKKANFFNDLKTINKSDSYREITIRRDGRGRWIERPIKGSPYEIKMNDSGLALYDIETEEGVDSNKGESYSINLQDRNLHFIKTKSETGENIMYLLFIDTARDTFKVKSQNFVRFVELKIEPIISLGGK